MLKQATAGIIALGALGGAVDATQLNVAPVQAEYQIKEHVSVKQVGDVVEATLPWKDQPGLKVKYNMGKATAKEKLTDKRGKQVVVEQVSSDAMKIDIILNSKPKTNKFCYTIEGWEDYNFFYQPALTQEEIADGAERPEEIVGSYAVYHKTLRDHIDGQTNYETGKVAHIPYPYVWEVGATSTTKHRAEAFSIKNGNMCVTVAQSDLDTMQYPVRVDPTFGYTTQGASNATIADRTLTPTYRSIRRGINATGTAATLDKISAYLFTTDLNDSVDFSYVISTKDSGGAGTHAQLVKLTGTYTGPTTPTLTEVSAASQSLTNVTYIINLFADGTTINSTAGATKTIKVSADDTGSTEFFESFTGAGSYASAAEDPWTVAAGTGAQFYSIYATYTASGGATSATSTTPVVINGGTVRIQGGTFINTQK